MPETLDLPPAPSAQEHCWLPCSRHSPALARRLLRESLARVEGGERFLERAELLVSELVTNAVLHGTKPGQLIRLSLAADQERLWISVEDASSAPPRPHISTDGQSGRGLLLVDKLSEQWGWGPREGIGKCVWSVCTSISEEE
ncbi:ATP-binding protein [Kitasatospora kifunensis]|uniref:Anti-sigma regulatory factor (Ser/Thr protein kinase) n=1 Tax=Kitasatospora kifunensis TaxID=58351 RepID=A0A7W7QZQ1_KITKI|nr:ATP-binding protein [Kitasatospora kifunensis]MBB4922535.1 anti-sigma regulatory factor (Ser/Thr protein kinase) [Kitasatospora kifunensis]